MFTGLIPGAGEFCAKRIQQQQPGLPHPCRSRFWSDTGGIGFVLRSALRQSAAKGWSNQVIGQCWQRILFPIQESAFPKILPLPFVERERGSTIPSHTDEASTLSAPGLLTFRHLQLL